ncbi:hypothetical protein GFC30_2887 [Anoxybacillus amylolyticus]|uniref:Uncharacterized protein n=1 Tax=Anoxybacteroides amylolyticum TaxID=294699 RepID=A0A160F285_9BACL|nr:hypothetical protein GFC30_2887 [Anoxybacillus amylolyticus]
MCWKRGETLKPVLFILLAFVVAIPLLFMLPLGLSRRGKMVALFVSLLLSLLAATASAVFPLWQLSLLLLLMAIAITYVLDRRFGHVLYAIVEEEDELFTVEEEAIAVQSFDKKQQLAPSFPNLSDVQLNAETETIADELAPLQPSDSEVRDGAELDDWLEEDTLEENSIAAEKAPDAWTEEDYLPPLSLEEYETMTKPAVADDVENDDTFEWLEDSERLDELEEKLERTSDNSLEETTLPIELGLDALLEEEGAFERASDNLMEETILLEPKLGALFEEEIVPSESLDELLEADEPTEQLATLNVASMPSELMQTIIDELHFIRQFVGGNEFEQRLLQCMQPSLSDHDYYVFAKMLIEHYLFEKEYDKLSSWLIHLRERFSRYPVLLEEIQFLSHIEK